MRESFAPLGVPALCKVPGCFLAKKSCCIFCRWDDEPRRQFLVARRPSATGPLHRAITWIPSPPRLYPFAGIRQAGRHVLLGKFVKDHREGPSRFKRRDKPVGMVCIPFLADKSLSLLQRKTLRFGHAADSPSATSEASAVSSSASTSCASKGRSNRPV